MKQAKGEFTPKGSEDILRKDLGIKEPSGRARAIGNHVPHKEGIPSHQGGGGGGQKIEKGEERCQLEGTRAQRVQA